MVFLQNWRESLGFFKPSSLKLFALVSLKSIISCYLLLGTYYWHELLAQVILLVAYGLRFSPTLLALSVGIAARWAVAAVLATRASVAPKNQAYFTAYDTVGFLLSAAWVALKAATVLAIPKFLMIMLRGYFVSPDQSFEQMSALWRFLTTVNIVPVALVTFALLFFLDGVRMPVKHACIMAWHNWPMLFIFENLFSAFTVGMILVKPELFVALNKNVVYLLFSIVRLPIYISLVTNIYIKKIHEQPTLYFGGKTE